MNIYSLLVLVLLPIHTCWAVKVQLSGGIIEGYHAQVGFDKVRIYKKVPFAEPPLGKLRFQKPQPKQPWHGVWDATKYSHPCMSNTSFTTSPQKNVSEDCLYLNVFADERCLRKVCPILFYIHGGGYFYDSAVMFNDTDIIHKYASHEIVFVIPAYRLGVFGFFDLGREQETAPYNAGVYDLLLALKWIKKEGARFGGNVNKIICMGNSAGASMIELLIVSPALKLNTFEKVIISSGVVTLKPHLNLEMSQLIAAQANCSMYSNSTNIDLNQQLRCLRESSGKGILDAMRDTEQMWYDVGPQTDEVLFPGQNYAVLLRKYLNPVPMLITVTKDELLRDSRAKSMNQLCQTYSTMFGYKTAETVKECTKFYANSEMVDITRDMYHVFAFNLARVNTRQGQSTFLGVFAQVNHSDHASDLTYILGLHSIHDMTKDDRLMDIYYPKLIRHFIKYGVPQSDWLPVNKAGQNYYYINIEHSKGIFPHLVPSEAYSQERIDLWLKHFAAVEWNATHKAGSNDYTSVSPAYEAQQKLLQLNAVKLDEKPASNLNNSEPDFNLLFASSQMWVIFWIISCLAIVFSTIILVMTASRLMFTYQSNRGYTLAMPNESTKILDHNGIRKYV